MSDYGADSDFERALSSYTRGYESGLSSLNATPSKKYVTSQLAGSKRRGRASRLPRKKRFCGIDEWNEQFSDEENILRLRKRRFANMRRRGAYGRPRRASPRRLTPPPPGGRPVVLEDIETDDTESDAGSKHHPEILSRRAKTARKRRMRRADRDVTPEWIEVPSDEEYRYSKFSCFQGSRKFTLAEWLLPKYRKAGPSRKKCAICADSHDVGDCPFRSPEKKKSEKVDMGQLFSFMRQFAERFSGR